jgi:hypothetical protein
MKKENKFLLQIEYKKGVNIGVRIYTILLSNSNT